MMTITRKSVRISPEVLGEISVIRRHLHSEVISEQKKRGYRLRYSIVKEELQKFKTGVKEYLSTCSPEVEYEVRSISSVTPLIGKISEYSEECSYFVLKPDKGGPSYISISGVYSISEVERCRVCRKKSGECVDRVCKKCKEEEDGI